MTSLVDKAMLGFLKAHDTLYQKSHGWLGHRLPFAPPMLLLHSVGAKTGAQRTHSLAYYRDGKDYVVVASNGGADRNPAWYHNLMANPHVDINVGPRRLAVTAHEVFPGSPDYKGLWKIADGKNAGRYSAYQKKTKRRIPVIRLVP